MICKYCNTRNPDDTLYCYSCGRLLAKGVVCPNCKVVTSNGKYCDFCGAYLPQNTEKRECPQCGNLVSGSFCSVCGMSLTLDSAADSPKSSESRREPVNFVKDYTVSLPQEKANRYENTVRSVEAVETEEISEESKRVISVFSIVGLIGIFVLVALSFLTGMAVNGSTNTMEHFSEWYSGKSSGDMVYMYYFFATFFENISEGRETAYGVIIAVICAVLVIAMIVMLCLGIREYSKSTRTGDTGTFTKYVLLAYVIYAACILMFRSMVSANRVATRTSTILTGFSLNIFSILGLSIGGALTLVCYVGNVVKSHGDSTLGVGRRYVLPAVSALFLILSAVCLSDIIVRLGEPSLSGGEDIAENYMMTGLDYDYGSAYLEGSFAQGATLAFIVFAFLMVYRFLLYIHDPQDTQMVSFFVIATVAVVVAAVFASLLAETVMQDDSLVYHDTDRMYVGITLYAVSFVLTIVIMSLNAPDRRKMKQKKTKAPKEPKRPQFLNRV